jgi:uncharacterized protein YegP (UPF0339 family)
MKIVIKKGGSLWWKKYHFTAQAENNRILFRSRKVGTVDECVTLINRIKKFCETGIGLKFDIDKNYNGKQKYHFRIINDDSEETEILAWSENYTNRGDCQDAIELINTNINSAEIIEL